MIVEGSSAWIGSPGQRRFWLNILDTHCRYIGVLLNRTVVSSQTLICLGYQAMSFTLIPSPSTEPPTPPSQNYSQQPRPS